MEITIYHNPRCSKSRQTLALIEEAGYEPTIVKYLEDPLSASDIQTLMTRLGVGDPQDIMRKGEVAGDDATYKENLATPGLNEDQVTLAINMAKRIANHLGESHHKRCEKKIAISIIFT